MTNSLVQNYYGNEPTETVALQDGPHTYNIPDSSLLPEQLSLIVPKIARTYP